MWDCVIPIAIAEGAAFRTLFCPLLRWTAGQRAKRQIGAPHLASIAVEQGHSVPTSVGSPAPRLPLISDDLAAEVTCLLLSSVPSPSAVWQGCCGTAVRPGPRAARGRASHVQSRCLPRPLVAAGVTPAGGGLPCRQGALAMQCNHWHITSVRGAWQSSTKLGEIPLRPPAGARSRPPHPVPPPPASFTAVGAQAHQAAGSYS